MHDYSLLLWNFNKLPENFFTLYGNVSAGIASGVGESIADLVRLGIGLQKWKGAHPTWDLSEKFQCQIRCTSGGNLTRDIRTNTPYKLSGLARSKDLFGPENLLKQPSAQDWQNGIAKLDICRDRPHRLQLGSDGCWMPGGDCLLYEALSSYISIPEGKIRQYTHFGWTSLDAWAARATTPGQPEQTVTKTKSGGFEFYTWRVEFGRAISYDGTSACLWIMDLDITPPPKPDNTPQFGSGFTDTNSIWKKSNHGIQLEAKDVSATGFLMEVSCPSEANLRNIKIGFMAAAHTTPGLHWDLHTVKVKYPEDTFSQPIHDYTPEFMPFPKGLFTRTPAIATMLRSFMVDSRENTRLDVDFGVSRDGIVVKGSSWASTWLYSAEWRIIAIGTELQA